MLPITLNASHLKHVTCQISETSSLQSLRTEKGIAPDYTKPIFRVHVAKGLLSEVVITDTLFQCRTAILPKTAPYVCPFLRSTGSTRISISTELFPTDASGTENRR